MRKCGNASAGSSPAPNAQVLTMVGELMAKRVLGVLGEIQRWWPHVRPRRWPSTIWRHRIGWMRCRSTQGGCVHRVQQVSPRPPSRTDASTRPVDGRGGHPDRPHHVGWVRLPGPAVWTGPRSWRLILATFYSHFPPPVISGMVPPSPACAALRTRRGSSTSRRSGFCGGCSPQTPHPVPLWPRGCRRTPAARGTLS